MSDHLPDCDDYAFSGAGYHPDCERICICRQVRRIEQRVRARYSAYLNADNEGSYAAGFRDAMHAAREAVAAECPHADPSEWCVYTAAIDALKTK